MNAPERILYTSFLGTGGSEGDNTSGASEVDGEGVLGMSVGDAITGVGL